MAEVVTTEKLFPIPDDAAALKMSTRSEAENGLRDSLARLRAIVDSAVDGIVSIREDGVIETLNPAAIAMFGYEPNELVGRNVKVLMPDPYRGQHDTYLSNYLRTGERRIIGIGREVVGRKRDGSIFPLELAVSEGRASGRRIFTGILRDLTEQKRAEENLRRQTEILDQIHESVVGTDLDGTVFFWNRAAERTFELSREEALGRPIGANLRGTNITPSITAEVIEKVIAHGHHEMRHAYVSRSGFEAVHRGSFSLVRDAYGYPSGVVAVTQDITELETEQRRARAAEELASIATLTAGIAHDIGTPMNVILGYAQMLTRSLDDERQKGQAQHIVDQVKRVTDLVHTLLNVARPRKTEPIAVSLERVAEHALGFLREKLRVHGIAVARDYQPVLDVRGDPDRLEQIFLNLFLNAADAMPDGGTLHVGLSSLDDHTVEARVSDTGVGISEDALERVFEPFFTTKERGKGNGLGLVVARGIALDHGGDLSVKSELGRGTEVTLRLPPLAAPIA